jgi:hypothetical protein
MIHSIIAHEKILLTSVESSMPKAYTHSINNKLVTTHRVVVHQFIMPPDDIFARFDLGIGEIEVGKFIHDWLDSDAGKWVKENSVEKMWANRWYNVAQDETQVAVFARLTDADMVFFKLRFS